MILQSLLKGSYLSTCLAYPTNMPCYHATHKVASSSYVPTKHQTNPTKLKFPWPIDQSVGERTLRRVLHGKKCYGGSYA